MGHLRTVVRPHSTDPEVLRKSTGVYARGKTPEITPEGQVNELDLAPGGPDVAARHVHEIHGSHGDDGVRRTMHGLRVTRGSRFVQQMLAVDPGLRGQALHHREPPREARNAIDSNNVGSPVPDELRDQFKSSTGHDVSDVQLVHGNDAHEAADAVTARAFTVGQRVFFGRGEYNPHSEEGRELIFHELAHTVQQRDAAMPATESLEVSSPGEGHEHDAHALSQSVNTGQPVATCGAPIGTARIQRVITFTTAVGAFNNHDVVADEAAAGFELTTPGADSTFDWTPDVTIHGNAGDVFADWETAHHQVGKAFWFNVFWGTGADRTHLSRTITGGLPMRDATAAGNTWYHDPFAQGFTADGETLSPNINDTPTTGTIPWDNPVPGRTSTRGWFNYGFGFVSTLSARHIPDGTGAGAFRHLNHVHWNFMLNGSFDTTAAVGTRVTVNGGQVNRSGMIPGIDRDNPPMHGGDIINDNFADTTT